MHHLLHNIPIAEWEQANVVVKLASSLFLMYGFSMRAFTFRNEFHNMQCAHAFFHRHLFRVLPEFSLSRWVLELFSLLRVAGIIYA